MADGLPGSIPYAAAGTQTARRRARHGPFTAGHGTIQTMCLRRSATLVGAVGALFLATIGLTGCTSVSRPDQSSSTTATPTTATPTTAIGPPSSSSVPTVSAARTAVPSAEPTGQEKQVGPLFAAGAGEPHGCSASVVHSPGRDLLITAAHCIHGTGVGEVFAPDYRDGASPYLKWPVERAWVSVAWASDANPDFDFAFLQVAGNRVGGRTEQVEDIVGAEDLGSTPAPDTIVSVVGYTRGIDDRQITCDNALTRLDEFPAFSCHGYVGGTSGSPFLIGSHPRVIVGLIGGHDRGGCTEAVSYSSPFGAGVRALYAQALGHQPADKVPSPPAAC